MAILNKSKIILITILLLSLFLRLYRLGVFPPSLYSDEADQGYNAYSLLKTGRDEHGEIFPASLRSFGDWKPPLPTYLMIPSIYLFGLDEISVRLPSAILGISSVYLTCLLVSRLLENEKNRQRISLLAAFILAVSPWHLSESRSAMLVAVAFFFIELGIYFFVKGKSSAKYYIFGSFFLALSIYAYYGTRVIVPLLVVFFVIQNKLYKNLKILLMSALVVFLVTLPLIFSYFKNTDVVFGRAKTVSVFYDKGAELRLWELISQDGLYQPAAIVRFFHNKAYLYFKEISRNFLIHFDLKYLLLKGDESQPFYMPGIGIIYLLDGLFLYLGLFYLFKKKLPSGYFIFSFLIISIIPASLTFMVPTSNRTFNAVFPFSFLISLGIISFVGKYPKNVYFPLALVIFYSINIFYFLNLYFKEIPLNYQSIWNYGWKETVKYVNDNARDVSNIFVSGKNGMPYVYFLFYNKYDPRKFQKIAVRDYSTDQFGFENVDSFDRYYFPLDLNWDNIKENHLNDSLYIIPENELPSGEKSGAEIKYQNGKVAVRIFKFD